MGEETRRILEEAGRALYGVRWQSSLARDLGTTDRNLRYWFAGTTAGPADLKTKLIALLGQRGEELERVIARIEQITDGDD